MLRLRLPHLQFLRRVLPHSLLWRSLLMILLPLVIVQAVALEIFYGSHLDVISRRFASAIAGEIAVTIDILNRCPEGEECSWILKAADRQWQLTMRLEPQASLPRGRRTTLIGPVDKDLAQALRESVARPFTVDWASDPKSVLIRVQLPHSVLDIEAPRKRLYTETIYIFVIWLVGSALLLFSIAALFMRNQVRAIRRLAMAAEAFGLGRDQGPIKPEGATEVRQAATAFNRMQERIRRFLQQRTEMLAGVSHDLRTPLTRLRLALVMLPATEETREEIAGMTADLEEMDRLVGGYLSFARGEGTERVQLVDLAQLLDDVAAAARRSGAAVTLDAPRELSAWVRPDAFRRVVTNLLDNACRHGKRVALELGRAGAKTVQICVDDDGPGIAPERREEVFRSFVSGAPGGTGLGLTIARDIVRAHGGEILLDQSPLGGLRARVVLPL